MSPGGDDRPRPCRAITPAARPATRGSVVPPTHPPWRDHRGDGQTADDRHGARLRALIVVLWRGGLRVQEALAARAGPCRASAWWMVASSRLIAPSCSSIALSRPSTPALALSAATTPVDAVDEVVDALKPLRDRADPAREALDVAGRGDVQRR
jgi:hypothetical protein